MAMAMTRRSFLAVAGGGVAGVLGGCDRIGPILLGPTRPVDMGAFVAPVGDAVDNVTHALNRLTFGPRPGDYARVSAMGVEAFIEEQLAPESIDDGACDALTRRLETLALAPGELFEFKEEVLRRELTHNALLRATYSARQLHEVMVEFWSDHFNIDISKGDCPWLKVHDDHEVIRKHVLGRFPEMLRASALSPAMLWYLDGRSNRKQHDEERPNENYARELLELHTLGVHGGYTQEDVMEVARCLTGWTVRSNEKFGKGRVEFRPGAHDNGAKTVLGAEIPAGLAEGDLDQVLDLVSRHPSTARHLGKKLCRRFIGPEPSESAVQAVATTFQQTGGDISGTLRTLIDTDAFWERRSTQFKRPFRFVVSALRGSNATVHDIGGVYDYLMRMGHAPYQYPTPDGYPEEAHHWYGSMLWRWHFALALEENRVPGVMVDWAGLKAGFDDNRRFAAHWLGRAPGENDAAFADAAPAVLLGSPEFQWC